MEKYCKGSSSLLLLRWNDDDDDDDDDDDICHYNFKKIKPPGERIG